MAKVHGEAPREGASRDEILRRTYIGGSDAPAVVGASRWESPLGVWMDKRGLRSPKPVSERMEWGIRLEAAVAQAYAERVGLPVSRGGFRRHPRYRFVGGHVDRIRSDGRPLEVKTSDSSRGWGEDGSSEVPPDYWVQCQHYLMLLGEPVIDVAVLIRGNSLRVLRVERDDVFTAMLLDRERDFWSLVERGESPDPDDSEASERAVREMFRRAEGPGIIGTPEIGLMVESLAELTEERDRLERRMAGVRARIEAYMGPAPRMDVPGWVVTWPERKGSVRWSAVAAGYRNGIIEIGKAIREGDFDKAEALTGLDFEAIEGLYRGEPSRVFGIVRKGGDEDGEG